MRVGLVALVALTAACREGLFGPSCPDRADAVRERLAALAVLTAEVEPWAAPGAPAPPVPNERLASVRLPFAPSGAGTAVALDGTGRRYVGDTAVGDGRSALCDALGEPLPEGRPPVRVLVDAEVRATLVTELLADLHSCRAYRIDLVFARAEPPEGAVVAERPAEVPSSVQLLGSYLEERGCPADLAEVASAPASERPTRLGEALAAAHLECRCVLEDDEIITAWRMATLPKTFVTTLGVRPSPSAAVFGVAADEPWQSAAERLVRFAGPDPQAHAVMLWVANEGTLVPSDDVTLPPPP